VRVVCGWCLAVKVDEQDWRPAQEVPAPTGLVSHGICPRCLTAVEAKLDANTCSQEGKE